MKTIVNMALITALCAFVAPADSWAQTVSAPIARTSTSKSKPKKRQQRRRPKPVPKKEVRREYLLVYAGGGLFATSSPGPGVAPAIDFGVGGAGRPLCVALGGTFAIFKDKTRSEGQVYLDFQIMSSPWVSSAETYAILGGAIIWNKFEGESIYGSGGARLGAGVDFRADPRGRADWDFGLGLKGIYSISPVPYKSTKSVQHQFMLMADLKGFFRGRLL